MRDSWPPEAVGGIRAQRCSSTRHNKPVPASRGNGPEWLQQVEGDKAKDIWKFSSFGEKWKEVIVARISIGHTRFTHKYLIEKTEQPKCNNCKTQITVKHITGECPLFNVRSRRNFKNVNNFKEIIDEGNGFGPERNLNS